MLQCIFPASFRFFNETRYGCALATFNSAASATAKVPLTVYSDGTKVTAYSVSELYVNDTRVTPSYQDNAISLLYTMGNEGTMSSNVTLSFTVSYNGQSVDVTSSVRLNRTTYFPGKMRVCGDMLLDNNGGLWQVNVFNAIAPVNSEINNTLSPWYQKDPVKLTGTTYIMPYKGVDNTHSVNYLLPVKDSTTDKVRYTYKEQTEAIEIYPTKIIAPGTESTYPIHIYYHSPSGMQPRGEKGVGWLSLDWEDTDDVNITVAANTAEARTASVDFLLDDVYTSLDVEQAGSPGSITVTPSEASVPSSASTASFAVTTTGQIWYLDAHTEEDWLTVQLIGNTLKVNAAASSNKTNRVGTVYVTGYDAGSKVNLSVPVTINQAAPAIDRIVPVWKDYLTEFNGKDSVDYTVDINGVNVYSGKAFRMPDNDRIVLNINRIAENYLASDADFGQSYKRIQPNDDATAVVSVNTSDGQSDTWAVIYDWSYGDYDGNLSLPVSNVIDSRMFSPKTTISKLAVTTDWESDAYTKKSLCGCRYGVYYLNSKGGWDAFAFTGKGGRKDTITRSTIEKATYNTETRHRVNDYDISSDSAWSLYTGILNDNECERMWNLVTSPKVYLHNLDTDEIIPVNVSSSTFEFKRTAWTGWRKIYQVEFKRAMTLTRR